MAEMDLNTFVAVFGGAPRGGFIAQYKAVYDSWTTKPDADVAAQQNLRVKTLVDGGQWAKKDVDYVFAAHTNDNGEALTNWFNPGTFNATMVNMVAGDFTAFEGFTGDGSTKHIRFNWIPGTDGINFIQDSASEGFYSRTDVNDASWDLGARDDAAWSMIQARSSGNVNARINDLTSSNTAVADSLGQYILSREGAAIKRVYKNKTQILDLTIASTGLTNFEFYALAYNNRGVTASRSIRQQSFAYAGGAYTQADGDAETDANEIYMDSNGKGVIA